MAVRGIVTIASSSRSSVGAERGVFPPYSPEGKREAETFLQIAKTQQENEGVAALSIPEELRIEAVKCQTALGTGQRDVDRCRAVLLKARQTCWRD